MSLMTAWIILLLAGVGLASLAYVVYRHYVRGKIICYIYTKNRQFYRRAVRPDALGLLHIGTKAYSYKEEMILTTVGFALREPTPALIFEEGRPNPVNLYQKHVEKMGEEDISSSELSRILNDGTVRDFVTAQAKINLTQVTYVILGSTILLAGVVVGVGYWIKGIALPI